MQIDKPLLLAALRGYEMQLAEVNAHMNELRRQLGAVEPAGKVVSIKPRGLKPRGPMSAAAKHRIAAAQKKRWALFRKQQKRGQVA